MASGRWRTWLAVLACALALSACGDRTGGEAAAPAAATAEGDSVLPDSTLRRMRRDSLRAFRQDRRHAAEAQRRARQQAGIEDDQPPLKAPAATGEDAYRSCMAQAAVAEGHIRRKIEEGCERARQAP